MIITLIFAMSENRVIGRNGTLPWRLSADLKHFKRITMGHHMIMGRKTFESIGKALPGRTTIVVTRSHEYSPPQPAENAEIFVAYSLEDALSFARARGESEVFITGGATIYAQTLPLAQRIYLTLVHTEIEGDTYLPEFDETRWVELEQWPRLADEKNEFAFTFKVLEKREDG